MISCIFSVNFSNFRYIFRNWRMIRETSLVFVGLSVCVCLSVCLSVFVSGSVCPCLILWTFFSYLKATSRFELLSSSLSLPLHFVLLILLSSDPSLFWATQPLATDFTYHSPFNPPFLFSPAPSSRIPLSSPSPARPQVRRTALQTRRETRRWLRRQRWCLGRSCGHPVCHRQWSSLRPLAPGAFGYVQDSSFTS